MPPALVLGRSELEDDLDGPPQLQLADLGHRDLMQCDSVGFAGCGLLELFAVRREAVVGVLGGLGPADVERHVPWLMLGPLVVDDIGLQPHDQLHPIALRASGDRKSTRLNSSHVSISYAVFCLKKKKKAGDRK